MAAKALTIIQPTAMRLPFATPTAKSKRRVADYARVSTNEEEQLTSYEAQVDCYTRPIQENDEWELVEVYTDEDFSATSTKKRDGFNRMIADALVGKLDLILTKSVSRFARNFDVSIRLYDASAPSYLQRRLQGGAGGFLAFVEGVGVDVQSGRHLGVAEETRDGGDVCAFGDEEAGVGVPERVDVQILGQAVLLEDELEAPGEGGGRHGQSGELAAEDKVIVREPALVIGQGLSLTEAAVLTQQGFHLGGEVHIPIPSLGLGLLRVYLVATERKARGINPLPVLTGGFPPMLLQIPCKYESIPCGLFIA